MRLRVLHHGHRTRQRLALRLMRLVGRTAPDPVVVVCLYRPELFGKPFLALLREVMRGPSEWSSGERELFATSVSRLNSCPFCVGIHSGMAQRHQPAGADVLGQLDRWREGTLPAGLSATLRLLEKLTMHPEEVTAADMEPVREAGVSDSAIRDALYVALLFNTINRVANAFDFGWETEADRLRLIKGLNRVNYRVPGFLLG